MKVCENCHFSAASVHGPRLDCRRYAPRITYGMVAPSVEVQDKRDAVWPLVDNGDWCGEYRPRIEAAR